MTTVKTCKQCRRDFEARGRAIYCCDKCRRRAHHVGTPTRESSTAPPLDATVTDATRSELERIGELHSPLGRSALVLAGRLDMAAVESGPGLASVAKELRALLFDLSTRAQFPAARMDPLERMRARYLRNRNEVSAS